MWAGKSRKRQKIGRGANRTRISRTPRTNANQRARLPGRGVECSTIKLRALLIDEKTTGFRVTERTVTK